jgi:hypothetical protein
MNTATPHVQRELKRLYLRRAALDRLINSLEEYALTVCGTNDNLSLQAETDLGRIPGTIVRHFSRCRGRLEVRCSARWEESTERPSTPARVFDQCETALHFVSDSHDPLLSYLTEAVRTPIVNVWTEGPAKRRETIALHGDHGAVGSGGKQPHGLPDTIRTNSCAARTNSVRRWRGRP